LGRAFRFLIRRRKGIDLHCTFTEKIGQRIWPLAYYFVQVKSTEQPWRFNSKKSVVQFLTLPLPMFLCIVTKKDLRLRVCSTCSRLSILREIPDELSLFPSDMSDEGNRWHDATNRINLEQPILDFTLNEIVDPALGSRSQQNSTLRSIKKAFNFDRHTMHEVS